ncbi:MAG TPA: guanylate kinase [Bacteroidales bacterium]|nr:guanylate kinase [Bacteroidales bacterium]
MQGKMIIFSAPSGSGKTTIVKWLLSEGLPLEFSVSATSRSPRSGEVNGKDYYFLSADEFKNKITNDELIEWQEVYTNKFYGTFKSEITRIWNSGKHVIFDVDVLGGRNLKSLFGDTALSIFIMPPSVEELEKRLRGRNTDPEDIIKQRIDKAVYEMSFAKDFDKIIINDNLETAQLEAYKTIKKFVGI